MAAVAETFEIKRAERRQARLRLALAAASNGGKTWSALELAFGITEELISRGLLEGTLEGKVGMVDTERKSGQLYAHLGPFDTIELGPPYTVERYVGALTALERSGCAVIILDSISHAWAGAGGVLSLLDQFQAKERFSAFGTAVNPQQDEFVDAMLRSPAHIIATMRSKTAWVLEDKQTRSGGTVKAPRRIGMAPIQRPGIEYEFTSLLDLETNTHFATVVKNRCPVFEGWAPKRLTREHGRALAAWLLEGAPEPAAAPTGTPLERATAASEAGKRACERAENLPDLARIFEGAVATMRGFAGVVDAPELVRLTQRVIDAKDARKAHVASMRGGQTPAADVIEPDDVIALEAMLFESGASITGLFDLLQVGRLALVPRARLGEVCQWICDQAAEAERTVALPERFAAAGITVRRLATVAAAPAAAPAPHQAAAAKRAAGKWDDFEDDIPF